MKTYQWKQPEHTARKTLETLQSWPGTVRGSSSGNKWEILFTIAHHSARLSLDFCLLLLFEQIARQSDKQFYIGMVVNLDKSFRWTKMKIWTSLGASVGICLHLLWFSCSWLDGTPVTYTAWDHNEPNFANNDENCVTIYSNMGESNSEKPPTINKYSNNICLSFLFLFLLGYWNDINCGLELPSVCRRSNGFINTTVAPTAVSKGGCAPQWILFKGKVIYEQIHKWNTFLLLLF